MVLYAADLNELAPKKISKKRKAVEETPASPDLAAPEKVEKKKRVLTDAQKEALKKGQEARKLKKAQEAEEKKIAEEVAQKLIEAAPKKKKAKKVQEPEVKAEPITPAETEPSSPVKTEPVKVEKKKRVKKEQVEPPAWFKKYVEGVQKEKASTEGQVTKKQENIIKNEALRVAKKSWQSGYTRDRVQSEVDSHMNRMYSMIFGR